ncbi:MAG: hypothetical protein ACRDM2_11445 [Gaiellaceae bacterium]
MHSTYVDGTDFHAGRRATRGIGGRHRAEARDQAASGGVVGVAVEQVARFGVARKRDALVG